MSVTEILKELPKLSAKDRATVWKNLGEITEAVVPASFGQVMRDFEEDLTSEELKLVEARLEAYQKGQIKAVDGEVALRKLRTALRAMRS
jgi:hypothetical protein